MPTPFIFGLGHWLRITCSNEPGQCISRSESLTGEPQYLLRYKAADGRAVEAWWAQSALSELCGPSAVERHDVPQPPAIHGY